MQMPIRCMTCGKPIAQYWEDFNKRVKKGEDPRKVLDSVGVERYCCRSVFLTHVDMTAKVGKFQK
jgi:DNA-directed RNA polymerase subunit N